MTTAHHKIFSSSLGIAIKQNVTRTCTSSSFNINHLIALLAYPNSFRFTFSSRTSSCPQFKMITKRDLRRFILFFPALKLATTTIPLTFFDFATDVYSISIYANSPAKVVRVAAAILGERESGLGLVGND